MDQFVASVFGDSCTLHITGISVDPLLTWQKPDTVSVHHMLVNALNTVWFTHHVHDLTQGDGLSVQLARPAEDTGQHTEATGQAKSW